MDKLGIVLAAYLPAFEERFDFISLTIVSPLISWVMTIVLTSGKGRLRRLHLWFLYLMAISPVLFWSAFVYSSVRNRYFGDPDLPLWCVAVLGSVISVVLVYYRGGKTSDGEMRSA